MVQITFSFIDFEIIIRKIKFDKIIGREASENMHTEYLNVFKDDIKDIQSANDLFIATLINS